MDILREDVDRLFSYNTLQQVRIPDKVVGLANNFVALAVILFFLWYVLLVDQGYYEYEPAKGATVTHVLGEVLAAGGTDKQSRYFSVDEITYPSLENGNVMVATKVDVKKQKKGHLYRSKDVMFICSRVHPWRRCCMRGWSLQRTLMVP